MQGSSQGPSVEVLKPAELHQHKMSKAAVTQAHRILTAVILMFLHVISLTEICSTLLWHVPPLPPRLSNTQGEAVLPTLDQQAES